jgi:hypothetical protein
VLGLTAGALQRRRVVDHGAVVLGDLFQSLTEMRKDREKVGNTAAAQLGGYGEARVSPGTASVGF